ncbi:hypothetical protein [Nitrosomonas communis]|uniref:beta strand repeat-containing protein n=1 Tax=Nitrosomonas communis TaxID=44574 RepID=UPI0026ED4ABD|nr:hypothetical protein [Nitrosomonas communis]MCO6428001.1 hypothetical protein [Nitrosomonas communis]
MAISDTQKEQIVALVVATFNAPPGATFLREFANAIEAGMPLTELANILVGTTEFQRDILQGAVTPTEISAALLKNFGLTAGNTDPNSPDAQAEAFFANGLEAGASVSSLLIAAGAFLLGNPGEPFAATSALFKNKVNVAEQYSVSNSDDNVPDLQAVLTGVTAAGPATDAEALQYLADRGYAAPGEVVGDTFTLTTNQDALTGATGNDTFNASLEDGLLGIQVNTLQDVDVLDGGAGTDTLNATLSNFFTVTNPPVPAPFVTAPTLESIENVNVKFVGVAPPPPAFFTANLNLANASGVNTVTIADSTSAGLVSGLGAAANLAVKNQTQNAIFGGSTAETLNLNLDTVGKLTPPTETTVHLLDATGTTLNVTSNNSNVLVDSDADAFTTLSVAATGENILNMAAAAKATGVTVTGTGSVDFNPLSSFTGELATFDAKGNSGGVKANIQSTKAVTVTGSSAADVFDMDTLVTGDSSIDLGAGDDKLFAGNQLAGFNKGANGGDGTGDIINITDGATLTEVNAAFITNFETLDVSGGTGSYDVSLNNFTTVQIDEAINGLPVGPLTFANAPDAFTLTIANQANDPANDGFFLGFPTTVLGKDFAGTDESFTLAATLHDGNKDNLVNNGFIGTNTIVADGVENLAIDAKVGTLDGGATATAVASDYILFTALASDVAQTLTITGDASVNLLGSGIFAVNKVDASTSTGNITLDFSAQTGSVGYTGAEGIDTYAGSAFGDTVYTGKGADVVTLEDGLLADLVTPHDRARDTFVLKDATDSQITDTSKDGKITLDIDTGFDEVINFQVGGGATNDRLDVTNFGFAGAQRGVVNVTAKVNATTDLTSIADLFDSAAGDRGVAYSVNAAGTFAFVDANKDGNFTAADDLVVKLTGVATLSETDINF